MEVGEGRKEGWKGWARQKGTAERERERERRQVRGASPGVSGKQARGARGGGQGGAGRGAGLISKEQIQIVPNQGKGVMRNKEKTNKK